MPGLFFYFLDDHSNYLSYSINTFLPVNASFHWLNNVSCLFSSMNWRCANSVGTVGFFKGSTETPILFEDAAIGLLLQECWIIIGSKYHLAHCLPNTRFYGVCRNCADFLN